MLALGLICTQHDSAMVMSSSIKSSIKSRLNEQINAKNLLDNALSDAQTTAFIQGLSQEQLLQTSQMLQADGDEQQTQQVAPVADEQAA